MRKVFVVFFVILVIILYFILQLSSKNINPKQALELVKTPQKELTKNTAVGGDLNMELSVADGYSIRLFADIEDGLPRALAFDSEGTLLASIPAEGKVVAFPDRDTNGVADEMVDVATGLSKPHGIAFNQNQLYIAETGQVIRYSYDTKTYKASSGQKLFDLPVGGRHFTRTIKIHDNKLYTSVGSSCDVCVEDDVFRSTILISNLDGSNLRIYAKGLRNTVFFNFDENGKVWGVDMGRDFLGDNLPPEEVNLIEDGKDYGWPYCYGNKIRDAKFMSGQNSDYCQNTQGPEFEMPAHIAPLGIVFDNKNNILISQHGSWNSTTPVGYKVVKLSVKNGGIEKMEDFISGFIKGSQVLGRPVDLIFDKAGNLFVSDDHAGLIYIVIPS